MTTLFVYGTLLRGERNHRVLGRAEYVGDAKTTARFTMFDLGSYAAIVAGGRTGITGELYVVDEAALATLDRLERHPNLYRRTEIELEGGGRAEAYVYVSTEHRRWREVASGSWRVRG